MAWLSLVTEGNTIVVSENQYLQYLVFLVTGYVAKRTATRTQTRYVGLTDAAASTQLTASLAVTGCVSASKERENDAGAYTVVEEKETYGDWEYEDTLTPPTPPA